MATILLCGVELFLRGKLEALLPEHRFETADGIDPPDVVIADIARVDPDDVADTYPDVPLLGFTNHTDRSCIDVCPVDCIHIAERVLVIDPEECIDCGACEPECPVEAIFPEDALPEKWEPFVRINAAFNESFDVVNALVESYAAEHDVQNVPLDQR